MVRDVWFRGDVKVESVVSVTRVRKLPCEKILTFRDISQKIMTFLISQRASGPDIRERVDFYSKPDFAPNKDFAQFADSSYSPHNLFPPVFTSTY